MAFELIGRVAHRFIGISVGLGIGGLFIYKSVADLCPHQICKGFTGLRDEQSCLQKVPDRCRVQFDEVAKKFGYENTDNITLFVNQGVYPFSAGSPLSPTGAVIGLPRWYLFETTDDVENSGIKFQGRDIKWDSELGVMIKECLLATDDTIAFSIGHELAHIQRIDYKLFNAVFAPAWLYITFRVANATPRFLKLHTAIDIVLKLCICRMSYLIYKRVNLKAYHGVVFKADEDAAKCDPRMAQGGVDFFSKRQQLNLILRRLHGQEGKRYYTKDGNEVESYIYPTLTDRLKRVKTFADNEGAYKGSRKMGVYRFWEWGSGWVMWAHIVMIGVCNCVLAWRETPYCHFPSLTLCPMRF